jgi:hypothetical protein
MGKQDKLYYNYHEYVINDDSVYLNSMIVIYNPLFSNIDYFRIEFLDYPEIRYFKLQHLAGGRHFNRVKKEEYDAYWKRQLLIKAIKELK